MRRAALVRRIERDRIDFVFAAYRGDHETYKLAVALPMPAQLFWCLTLRDPRSGAELFPGRESDTRCAAFELKDEAGALPKPYFGPVVPNGECRHWIKTMSERGWFTHVHINAPTGPHSVVDGARATIAAR